jgi:hypothetical protein
VAKAQREKERKGQRDKDAKGEDKKRGLLLCAFVP